jgi:hypothetical protein
MDLCLLTLHLARLFSWYHFYVSSRYMSYIYHLPAIPRDKPLELAHQPAGNH